MTVEIRTTGVKPIRNAFAHLERRFGDKAATRYQEIAYDVQPTANFHYKPLWDPDRDMYDVRRTAVVMADWHALKDPRQYYYGSYTTTRAKQQEAIDRQMEFAGKRDLLRVLGDPAQQLLVHALVPMRHFEFGANLNSSHMAAYGFGSAFTQAAMMATTDRLGMAQHLSRIGLLVDGNTGESLAHGKQLWMDDASWQGVRREMENLFVVRDWFHNFVVQYLCADAQMYPLMFEAFDTQFAKDHGPSLSTLTDYVMRWHLETARWVDACIKAAIAESDANKTLISGWVRDGRKAWAEALAPLAAHLLASEAEAGLAHASQSFEARASKLGLEA